MKITIPKTYKDLRIKHFEVFKYIKDNEITGIKDKVSIISLFSGVHESKIRQAKADDIQKAYSKCMDLLSSIKLKELPLELTYDNTTYVLVDKFKNMPVGWFIDSDSMNFEDKPEYFPAFCYIEKGMEYAQKDKNSNILNPLSERVKVFEKNMPLDVYIQLTDFFLRKYNQFTNSYKLIQKAKQKIKNKSLSSGKV